MSSVDVGAEKPDPAVFLAALSKANVEASEAIHVGDQRRSDVVGAQRVGIHPVLLDRGGWHKDIMDCVRINNLNELESLLNDAPTSLLINGNT